MEGQWKKNLCHAKENIPIIDPQQSQILGRISEMLPIEIVPNIANHRKDEVVLLLEIETLHMENTQDVLDLRMRRRHTTRHRVMYAERIADRHRTIEYLQKIKEDLYRLIRCHRTLAHHGLFTSQCHLMYIL